MSEKRFRTLLYEPIHQNALAHLAEVAEVRYVDDLSEAALIEAARDVDGIIIRAHGQITARIMDASARLTFVARHGAGVDNIDVAAATERGIYVANTPDANTESVAEHCIGLMIAVSRRLLSADQAVRQGRWDTRAAHTGYELQGKTLGVIGFGRIGQRVASICHGAFGMPIVYHDVQTYPEAEEALQTRWMAMDKLLSIADYVSVHVPLMPQTEKLIGAREFALMKPSCILLNLARGPVVDEDALVETLRERRIAGAGLDVFAQEPVAADNPLLSFDNVVVTPHLAALTEEAMQRMAMSVVQDELRVWNGEPPLHWVNRDMQTPRRLKQRSD